MTTKNDECRRLMAAVETVREGVIIMNARRRIVHVNHSAEEILGRGRGQLVGCGIDRCFPADLRAEVGQALDEAASEAGKGILLTFRSDGRVLSVNASALVDTGDATGGFAVAMRDITELVDEKERAEAIIASAADGLLVLDEAGGIMQVNKAAAMLLGVDEEQVIGRPVEEVIVEKDLAVVVARGTRGSRTRKRTRDSGVKSEEVVVGGPPRKIINVISTPVIDRRGKFLGSVKVIRDVTLEREIDRMKSEFISTVSHELRTPLTSIKGYVDLILDGDTGDISDIQREFLTVVKQNSDRLVALINDLLDLSRIESGRVRLKKEPLKIESIIDDVIKAHRMLVEQRKQELVREVEEPLPVLIGDHDRILQVITNLLSNAIKYTPDGGRIFLSAKWDDSDVRVAVRDTGVGISMADQKKLFEKFYRVDNSMTREIGGTGLGLSIAKTIINLHGGRIWVESKPGDGSRFTFTLPVAARPSKKRAAKPAVETGADATAAGRRILVVDDDEDIVRLLELQLAKDGFQIRTALSGEEALAIAKEWRPDLITIDVLMEGINGLEAIRRLREDPETMSIPVIVVSIVCDDKHQEFRFGAASYLSKPIDKDKLSAAIRGLTGEERPDKRVLLVTADEQMMQTLRENFAARSYLVSEADNPKQALELVKEALPAMIVFDTKMQGADASEFVTRLRVLKECGEIPVVFLADFDSGDPRLGSVLELETEPKCRVFSIDLLTHRIERMLSDEGGGA